MRNPNWELEEAVALFEMYFRGTTTNADLELLSKALKRRAHKNGIIVSTTFRNLNGLKMQLGCILYVVSDGKHGFHGASKLFFDTYDLYQNNKREFYNIWDNFSKNYM